jgi:Short C-terminal domain
MSAGELVRQLKALAELHTSGAISAQEFAAAKARLLGGLPRPPEQPVAAGSAVEHPTPAIAPASAPRGHGPVAPRNEPLPQPGLDQSYPPAVPPAATWYGSAAGPPHATPQQFPQQPAPGAPPWQAGKGPSPIRAAPVVVLACGLLTLLAFLAMPVATVPFFGSITGANLAAFSTESGSLAVLWLVPVAAVGVAGIGAWQQFAQSVPSRTRRRGSVAVLLLAGLVVLIYLIGLAAIETQISNSGAAEVGISAGSLAGAGFWITLLGMLAAGVAAVADLIGLKPTSGRP